jgi:hypothetical protein
MGKFKGSDHELPETLPEEEDETTPEAIAEGRREIEMGGSCRQRKFEGWLSSGIPNSLLRVLVNRPAGSHALVMGPLPETSEEFGDALLERMEMLARFPHLGIPARCSWPLSCVSTDANLTGGAA